MPWIRSILVDVSPVDPLIWGAVVVGVAAIVVGTAYVMASLTLERDPLAALRSE
jgi:hypothetical protein